MHYCEKHQTINISSFGCGLCSQEKAEKRKQRLERCERTLNYDIFKEIQGAQRPVDQDKEEL